MLFILIRNIAPVPLPGSISNRVWEDNNGNGIQESGKPGVTGLTVKLYRDNSSSGTADTLLNTITTAADGLFAFNNLDASIPYKVQFSLPANRIFTIKDAAGSTEQNDSDANPNGFTDKIVLTPGMNSDTGAGVYALATIGNRVWDDNNGNGIQDGGEPGVNNVEVQLYQDNSVTSAPDTLLKTTSTSGDGNYAF